MTMLLSLALGLVALFLVVTAVLALLVGQTGALGLVLTAVPFWVASRMLASRRALRRARRFGLA